MKKQITKAPTIKLSPNTVAINIEDDANVGQEAMSQRDFAIPSLSVLQDLSPQIKKTKTEYIKGAEVGMICDAVSATLFDGEQGVVVVPVHYRRANVEWKPNRGGMVKDHGTDDTVLTACVRNDEGRSILPGGNIVTVTAEYFVFLLDGEGGYQPYVLRMSGSQLKKARRWNTMINQLRVPSVNGGTFNPAMFYRSYLLTTTPEQNDKGAWMGWKVSPATKVLDLDNGSVIYQAARDFHNQIKAGAVVAAAHSQSDQASASEDANAPL